MPTENRETQLQKEDRDERDARKTVQGFRYLFSGERPELLPRVDTINLKNKGDGVIATLKRRSPEGPQVAFVMSTGPSKVIRKAAAFYRGAKLKWRLDEWEMSRLVDNEDDW